MFDIHRLYTSACSSAVQPVRVYPILMSILLFNFQELTKCVKEVEWMEAKVSSMEKERGLTTSTREQLSTETRMGTKT